MTAAGEPGRIARLAARLVARPRAAAAAVLALSLVLGVAAARVRPDYGLEQLFPAWDDARAAYDRYRARFPGEDARAAVVVSAPDLFTAAGVRRLARLEADLRTVPHVVRVLGPASVERGVSTRFGPARERLLAPELGDAELARRAAAARDDRLLAWNVFAPDGRTGTILVDLAPAAAGTDDGRQRFTRDASAVLARHAAPGQEVVLSGLPPVRARIAALLAADVSRLVPLALLLVLLLLLVAFRSAAAAAAALATLLAALLWTYGALGLLGFQLGMLMSVLPIIVVVVSVSDTVHVVSETFEELRRGSAPRAAIAAAIARTAVPCLVTELVLAAGFLTLVAIRVVAAVQFGVATAVAMLLTWLANVTVLPLVLGALVRHAPRPRPTPAVVELAGAVVTWIGALARRRPRRILVTAAVLLAAAALLGARVQVRYKVFDDLRPGSPLARDLRVAEAALGGLVPVAIHVEVEGADGAALDPAAIRVAERAAAMLRSFPEIRQANALADFLRPLHRLLAGDEGEGDGLPDSAEGAAQELATLGDRALTREVLSEDRRSLAAVGRAADAGSARVAELFWEVDRWVAREQAALDRRPAGPRIRLSATGQLRLFQDVNDMLLSGLAASFGSAVLLSLALMALALRSLRLGLVALVPNVAPIVLVLAFMALAGIALSPVTVLAFSITLVVADDDTIQFMARFRRNHAARASALAEPEAHRAAVDDTLGEVGVPMMLTGGCVSLGFLVLLLSEFRGPAHLGLLMGATLAAALLADLFLSPVLLAWLTPLAPRGGDSQERAVAPER